MHLYFCEVLMTSYRKNYFCKCSRNISNNKRKQSQRPQLTAIGVKNKINQTIFIDTSVEGNKWVTSSDTRDFSIFIVTTRKSNWLKPERIGTASLTSLIAKTSFQDNCVPSNRIQLMPGFGWNPRPSYTNKRKFQLSRCLIDIGVYEEIGSRMYEEINKKSFPLDREKKYLEMFKIRRWTKMVRRVSDYNFKEKGNLYRTDPIEKLEHIVKGHNWWTSRS